ncbi:MAG: type I restriction enzyme HsdR N-terminal domain-containing protein [Cyclobacteriaceae bacterium]
MQNLNLPSFPIKLSADKQSLFDPIRRKYIVVTPEEWVRQHFINYLVEYLNYPLGLLKVEFGIKYNHLSKRPDILAHDREGKPLLLIECKSSDVKIKQTVFNQVAVYNKILGSPLVVVTNGIQHFCWKQDVKTNKIDFLDDIPSFEDAILL